MTMDDDEAGQERTCVVVRGIVRVPEADQLWARRRLVELLETECDPEMKIDDIALAAPRVALDIRKRPMFRRCAVVPSALMRSVSRDATIGTSATWWHSVATWLSIVGSVVRVGASLDRLTIDTRRLLLFTNTAMMGLSMLGYLVSFQPRVFLQNVLTTFDFWYLMMQILAIAYLEFVGMEDIAGAGLNAGLHAVWVLSIILSFIAADSIAFHSRAAKAARFGVGAAVCAIQAVNWAVAHGSRLRPISLQLFDTTEGAVAQSLYITIGAFMMRFVFAIVADRNAAICVQLAAGAVIDTCLPLRRRNVA